jgi:hypothetical protein
VVLVVAIVFVADNVASSVLDVESITPAAAVVKVLADFGGFFIQPLSNLEMFSVLEA